MTGQSRCAPSLRLVLTILLGYFISRLFRGPLEKHKLLRPVRFGIFIAGLYAALIATHPGRMTDSTDLLALAIHKTFAALMVIIALRFLDRLIIIPILTRGGRVPLSRFVHQNVVTVLALFLLALYLHWAFDLDVSTVLAGSAVISIVLGLALQETLGNFFSGMVLQASVPFAPGASGSPSARGLTLAVEGACGGDATWRAVTIFGIGKQQYSDSQFHGSARKITNYHTARTYGDGDEHFDQSARGSGRRMRFAACFCLPSEMWRGRFPIPRPSVAVADYNASSISYTVGFWIDKPDQHGNIESAVRWNVWYRLQQAGIKIPSEIRTIVTASASGDHTSAYPGQNARLPGHSREPPFFHAFSGGAAETGRRNHGFSACRRAGVLPAG